MKELASTGRFGVAALVAFSLSAVVAVVVPNTWATQTALVLAIVFLGVFGLNISLIGRKIHRDLKVINRNVEDSASSRRLASLFENRSLDAPTPTETAAVEPAVSKELTSQFEASPRGSIFLPGAIPPNSVKEKPDALKAGRQAADQVMEDGDWNKLSTVLDPAFSSSRSILALAQPRLIEELEPLGQVVDFRLGQEASGLTHETEYVVIDENATSGFLYNGFLTTTRTADFLALMNVLHEVRNKSIPVIVVAADSPNHFSNTLRGLADIVVTRSDNGLDFLNDTYHPVISAASKYINESRTNV